MTDSRPHADPTPTPSTGAAPGAQPGLLEEVPQGEEERRQKHPPLGVVVDRPLGVLWARTAEAAGTRLCEDAGHPVYVRWHTRRRVGSPDETATVKVYACARCWPKEAR